MKISKRLRVISDFIPNNSFILDIGCDHALLDIYTVLTKKNIKAIASDINIKPLERARENVSKYKLNDKIIIKQGNGLSTYEKNVDTVILSGLGSTTIVNILKEAKEKDIKKLIISSNNDYYYLRKSICSLGFYIKDEQIVLDKGKYYPIIVFEKGQQKYNKFELKYGPVLLKNKSKDFINYLKLSKKKLIDIYNSLANKYFIKKILLRFEINKINKSLK